MFKYSSSINLEFDLLASSVKDQNFNCHFPVRLLLDEDRLFEKLGLHEFFHGIDLLMTTLIWFLM